MRLYRRGATRPEIVGPAGQPISVPAGEWTWIGEGAGYVSTDAGLLVLREGQEAARTIVWPVEPACTVGLTGRPWAGAERVDFVSLSFGSTYLRFPGEIDSLQIPAGDFLYYTVTARGPGAISDLRTCAPGESLPVAAPELPPMGFQDILVTATGAAELGRMTGGVQAWAELATGEELAPAAQTHAEGWAAFFFLNLPAQGRVDLRLSHPQLRTERMRLEPLERSAREVPFGLRERLTLEVPIDYRPRQPHRRAEVRPLSCGIDDEIHPFRCEPVGEAQVLQEGISIYRFAGLDGEQILLEARIDDEVLPGLASAKVHDLRQVSGSVFEAPGELLEEHHIYGRLLVAGEPVAGEVRWQDLGEGAPPQRVFPTGEEDLQFHLYYFGVRLPAEFKGMYPEALWKRLEQGLWGIGGLGRGMLSACDSEGFCKPFHIFSSISGDGRLDFDLGEGSRWRLQVLDSSNGAPIPGAQVLLRVAEKKRHLLHYVDGEVFPPDRIPGEALVQTTDDEGRASLQGLGPGSGILLRAEGFQPYRSELPDAGSELAELTIELEPLETAQGIRILLGGRPVDRGALLVLGESPQEDAACAVAIDRSGLLYLPDRCQQRPERRALLVHPEAELWLGSVGEVLRAGELSLAPRRGLPLSVRLLKPDGSPLAGIPLGLRFAGVELNTRRLILLAKGGVRNPHQTDERGGVTWSFFSSVDRLPELLLPDLGIARQLYPDSGRTTLEVVIDVDP